MYLARMNSADEDVMCAAVVRVRCGCRNAALVQYGINPHGYMTGFFASRPALKRYVRSASGFYQASKQLNVLAYGDATALTQFADAMGIAQHHDAGE